jgi:hypothetical protein
VKLQKTKADSPQSWSIDVKSIDQTTFELSVKNPSEVTALRSPQKIMDEIAALDGREPKSSGKHQGAVMKSGWQTKKLGELCEIELGKTPAISRIVRKDATGEF